MHITPKDLGCNHVSMKWGQVSKKSTKKFQCFPKSEKQTKKKVFSFFTHFCLTFLIFLLHYFISPHFPLFPFHFSSFSSTFSIFYPFFLSHFSPRQVAKISLWKVSGGGGEEGGTLPLVMPMNETHKVSHAKLEHVTNLVNCNFKILHFQL